MAALRRPACSSWSPRRLRLPVPEPAVLQTGPDRVAADTARRWRRCWADLGVGRGSHARRRCAARRSTRYRCSEVNSLREAPRRAGRPPRGTRRRWPWPSPHLISAHGEGECAPMPGRDEPPDLYTLLEPLVAQRPERIRGCSAHPENMRTSRYPRWGSHARCAIGEGAGSQSGRLAKATDAWGVPRASARRLGADEVWPRLTAPRIWPREVNSFVKSLPARQFGAPPSPVSHATGQSLHPTPEFWGERTSNKSTS